MTATSIDDVVDLAERQHLAPEVEAEFVDVAYATAFSPWKHVRRTDEEALAAITAACRGSIRVALRARQRARATWDLNPADVEAAEAHRLLTLVAAAFLPSSVDNRSYA